MKKFVPIHIIFSYLALFVVFTSLLLNNTSLASTTPQISGGQTHSLALKSDGTVWAWGSNDVSQLGDGTNIDSNTPVQVNGLYDVITISVGHYHNVVLRSDGTVWAWGFNTLGQIGDGTFDDRNTPIQLSDLSDVIAVACGSYHSLALKSDGTVWAWGSNSYGQLGDGTTIDKTTSIKVSGLSNVTTIAAGGNHSLALKSDGTVWTWGSNDFGQLGDGTYTDRSTPVQVKNISSIVAIAGGGVFTFDSEGSHSLALDSNGMVWAWGDNYAGQLGNGSNNTKSNVPAKNSKMGTVTDIKCGAAHSLALKSDGTVWAWGQNFEGELGDGTKETSDTPVKARGLSDVTSIGRGWYHSLAVKQDGTVWAWGGNWQGQLGDGTHNLRYSPVQVDINLGQTSTSTPTPTSSPKPTPTPTPKASPSPTATATSTPSPSPTPAEGTGVIYGFVLDENEFAFKNVSVTLTYANGYSKSTKTDSEGYYEFSNLAAGDYTLTYSKDGYQTQTQDVSLEEDESLDIGTITMEPVEKCMISGYVVDIRGDPIEYVKLKLKGIKTKKTKTAVTDADGFFEFTDLDADDYIITAKRSRYKSTRKTIQLEEGDEVEIEIEMKKTSRRGVMALDQ